METDDSQIWSRVLGGESVAFGLIWDRHHRRVLRHASALVATSADAEDVTASTFLEMWRKRHAIRFVEGSSLPWLLVTARNISRNLSRAQRRHAAFLSKLPSEEAVTAAHDLESPDPRIAQVAHELEGARPDDVTLLVMVAVEGFSIKDAGEALGMKESTARMRLSRLRQRVRSGGHQAMRKRSAS